MYSYCDFGTDYTDCGARGCSVHIVNGGFEEYSITDGVGRMDAAGKHGWLRGGNDDDIVIINQEFAPALAALTNTETATKIPAGAGFPDGSHQALVLKAGESVYQSVTVEPGRLYTLFYDWAEVCAYETCLLHDSNVDGFATSLHELSASGTTTTQINSATESGPKNGRMTNIFAGVWDSGYSCAGQAISSNVDRLKITISIPTTSLDFARPWVAFDNIELREVGSCADVPTLLVAESPPPPSPPPVPLLPLPPGASIGRRLETTAGQMDDIGSIEVWVSRNQATYGTRVAKINTTMSTDPLISVRLAEGQAGDSPEGRFVYIRSFDSARELRIDGVEFFTLPLEEGRRLGDNESVAHTQRDVQRQKPPPATKEERRNAKPESPDTTDTKIPKTTPFEFEQARKNRIEMMRNLTGEVCKHRKTDPFRARLLRRKAAQYWAHLSPDESDIGCSDCFSPRPMNCTTWFETKWGDAYGSDQLHEKGRKLREQLEKGSEERKRKLGEAIGDTCCRTSRKTGKKECGKQFCAQAIEAKLQPRMAHTLRRLHENPKHDMSLSVTELVATDMVAPHLHHDENCGTEEKRKKKGEIECISSSFIRHMADKYGFLQKDIDAKLDRYGLSIAQLVTAQLKHMSNGGQPSNNYRSDPVKADKMAAQRTKEKQEKNRRRMEQGGSAETASRRRRVGPRGSWIKKSTVEGRRRLRESSEETDVVQIGVEAQGDLRPIKKKNYEFARNQSMAAKRLLRAANLGAAQHGRKSLTQSDILRSAWDASLAADSSVIGRTRSVLGGIGIIAERVSEARELMNKPAPKIQPRKRRLAAHETAYLDGVDKLLGGRTPGFQPPDHHIEKYGWITESVDWVHAHKEGGRIAAILEERHEDMYAHVEEHGTLPVGEVEERHRTGYALLDMNAPPSRLGDYIRMLLPRMKNRRKRRLQARSSIKLYDVPRPKPDGGVHPSVVGAFVDAAVGDEDPISATWNALQHNDHRSHIRRSLEGLLGGASTVLPTVIGQNRIQNEAQTEPVNPITELARFLIYDVALCYLYPPVNQNAGNFGDGTGIEVHYSDRLCFPALPYAPPRMPTFGEVAGLSEDYDWNQLEYEQMCNSDVVKALIGPMSGELTAIGFLSAPYGSLLRFAEGIDSIRNLGVMTVASNHTENDRAAAIACGFAQFGGILWIAVVFVVLGFAFTVSLPCAMCCLRTCRFIRRGGAKAQRRSEAIDELLENAIDQGVIQATPEWVASRPRKKMRVKAAREERKGLLGGPVGGPVVETA